MKYLLLTLLILLIPLTVNGLSTLETNYVGKHTTFITINDGVIDYQTMARNGHPHLFDANGDYFLLGIRKQEYPDAPRGSLVEIEQWITDNPDVGPLPWTSTHPKEAGQEYQADLQSYKDSPLYNKTQAQIDAYIDSINDISTTKSTFKEITRVLKILMHSIDG